MGLGFAGPDGEDLVHDEAAGEPRSGRPDGNGFLRRLTKPADPDRVHG